MAETTSTSTKPAEIAVTLEEYARVLSSNDKRVEMVNAFYAAEKRAGRVKDVPSAYRHRFHNFTSASPERGNPVRRTARSVAHARAAAAAATPAAAGAGVTAKTTTKDAAAPAAAAPAPAPAASGTSTAK